MRQPNAVAGWLRDPTPSDMVRTCMYAATHDKERERHRERDGETQREREGEREKERERERDVETQRGSKR